MTFGLKRENCLIDRSVKLDSSKNAQNGESYGYIYPLPRERMKKSCIMMLSSTHEQSVSTDVETHPAETRGIKCTNGGPSCNFCNIDGIAFVLFFLPVLERREPLVKRLSAQSVETPWCFNIWDTVRAGECSVNVGKDYGGIFLPRPLVNRSKHGCRVEVQGLIGLDPDDPPKKHSSNGNISKKKPKNSHLFDVVS